MKRLGCGVLVLALMIGVLPWQAGAVELDLDGKSALLMDVATGTILYEKNAHEPLAPASVTKVMTMLLIMEAIDSGALHWEDTVTASEEAAAKGDLIFLAPCRHTGIIIKIRCQLPQIVSAPVIGILTQSAVDIADLGLVLFQKIFDLCIRKHYLLAVAHLQVHALKGDVPRTRRRRTR